MLHKHLVVKYVGDSAPISPSLHRVSIRHLAKAGSCCASGAGLSLGSCQTCMLYTQKSLGIDHQAYPALWLLVEKQTNLSLICSKKRDWWVTANCPSAISCFCMPRVRAKMSSWDSLKQKCWPPSSQAPSEADLDRKVAAQAPDVQKPKNFL